MIDLPLTVLTWIRGNEETCVGGAQTLTLPVYLNSARSELLFTVRLPVALVRNRTLLREGCGSPHVHGA
ncbi:Dynein heavy chain, cytoplasmic [Eumeta japonica]|uniref:Dynein heavy chain, cytoplasmic n=1 Tax=Eumeta variegata TaxID=151549 RepID=A0A4C1UZB2_EUMVA|nr:Dynein heavy chain, cytoplasmic [Eumeta japonica]